MPNVLAKRVLDSHIVVVENKFMIHNPLYISIVHGSLRGTIAKTPARNDKNYGTTNFFSLKRTENKGKKKKELKK